MIDAQGLLPRNKHDLDSIPRIVKAGYPAIAPILDALADFLVTLGPPLIDPISRILRGTDETHKWHCMNLILHKLPIEVLGGLEEDLRRLADHPSEGDKREGLDTEAREALLRLER
jgi:hypothetical protein